MIVTLGIYVFVWFYKNNKELNEVSGENFNVVLWTVMLLIPIVGLMGLYLFAEHIAKAHKKTAIQGKGAGVLFLLMFIPIVNIVGIPLTQAEINKVWA